MRQRNAALANGHGLRLGLFGANCSSGRTYATLPERWEASWENNRRLAQMADEIGIECNWRSEEHTSELQSLAYLVCRLLLEKKKKKKINTRYVMRVRNMSNT